MRATFFGKHGMEEKCPYRHLPFMERKGPPGWNGMVGWNGKAEGKARLDIQGTAEYVTPNNPFSPDK